MLVLHSDVYSKFKKEGVQSASTEGVQSASTEGVQSASTEGVQSASTEGVQSASTNHNTKLFFGSINISTILFLNKHFIDVS